MEEKTTKERIVSVADELFYQQGFEKTSFADIAEVVKLSRGNFYHHFKTKDDILDAVIDLRLARTQQMLLQWEQEGGHPEDRIRCFIRILIANQAKIILYGCPVGMLSSELARLEHEALPKANEIFDLFRSWLCKQFKVLGFAKQSDQLAMHLLARSQGVATLANAFHDKKFIQHEVDQLCEWLEAQVADIA